MRRNEIEKYLSECILQSFENNFELIIGDVELEQPNEIKNGHYSTNVALKNAKNLGTSPHAIAEKIKEDLSEKKNIEKIEVAGPGFLNFYLNDEFFLNMITSISETDQLFEEVCNKQKINIEFVSANPTGDLHLGHARNGIFGEAVGKILKAVGHDVTQEYYINDAGNQMNNLGSSIQYYYLELCNIKMDFPEDGYRGVEIQDAARKIYEEFNTSKKDESIEFFREIGYEKNLNEIKKILEKLGIQFDVWVSERDLFESGAVKTNLEKLSEKEVSYTKDGALWFNTSKYADEKDRVIQKNDGSYTYFASDIAYHIDKYNRGFDKLINIWGADHHGYIQRIKSAMIALDYDEEQLDILLIQMINILRNDEVVKMSKRNGTSVTIKELVEEIDLDVIKYFFLMRSPDTQMDFDIELAKKESSDNPIYYINYANARISSILTRGKEQNIDGSNKISSVSDIEKQIIIELGNYPKIVLEAANKCLPHLITNYLYKLSELYHKYYNAENVFNNNLVEINDKIIVAKSIQKIIKSGLLLLGIEAKDVM